MVKFTGNKSLLISIIILLLLIFLLKIKKTNTLETFSNTPITDLITRYNNLISNVNTLDSKGFSDKLKIFTTGIEQFIIVVNNTKDKHNLNDYIIEITTKITEDIDLFKTIKNYITNKLNSLETVKVGNKETQLLLASKAPDEKAAAEKAKLEAELKNLYKLLDVINNVKKKNQN